MKTRDYTLEEIEQMLGSGDLGQFVDEKDVQNILLHEVADEMQKILLKHIASDIYGAYTPTITPHEKIHGYILPGWRDVGEGYQYARRNSLLDPGNIYKEIIEGNTMFVTSDAKPNQSTVGSTWVPYGHGAFLEMLGTHPGRMWPIAFARPAIQNAQAEVDTSGAVEAAFERGLKRLGY